MLQEGTDERETRARSRLDRRELLVACGRTADVEPLQRGRRPGGTRRPGRPRVHRDPLVLLLAGLRAGGRTARRGRACPVHRLPRRACRGGARDDPHDRRRPHVRRELGPGMAAGTRSVPGRLARVAAGVARPRDRPPLRRSRGGRGLVALERDAALRRPGVQRRRRRLGCAPSWRRSGRRARCSPSRSATAPGASRSPAATTGTRCARWRRSSTSSARTPTRCSTIRCASRSRPRSRASWPAASASRSCSRNSASARTSRPTTTRPTTTGRSCTRRCSRAPAGGSPGTTATSTTSGRRTRTGTTSSRCTSGSPTGSAGRSSSCRRWPGSRRSCASCLGAAGSASPARPPWWFPSTSSASCRSPTTPTAATSAPTSCRPTSPRARRTSRSAFSASGTACPTPLASTSCRARSS